MLKNFVESAKNLSKTRSLAFTGMLIAMYAILGSIKIPLAMDNRITLTFAATSVAGIILGPVPAMIVGGAGDILAYMLNSGGGAYFFGFTISAALGGLVYGVCLYKRKRERSLWWIIVAVCIITFFINIILNTCWLSIMYSKAYSVFAVARILKNFAAAPVHIVVIFALYMLIERTNISKKL